MKTLSRNRELLLIILLLLIGNGVVAQELRSGDLLFVPGGNSDMEKAICESTGSYSHVAIAERDGAGLLWVIEAVTVPYGVRRIGFDEWIGENPHYVVYRLTVPFDTAAVLARANSFIGQPYDDAFLPDNGALYCSELVYEVYLDHAGNHLFPVQPMNWRDKEGNLPEYWIEHFRKLGTDVPEGVPGTNPTDLSRSPLLKAVAGNH